MNTIYPLLEHYTLLVVEDDVDALGSMEQIFQHHFKNVVCAANAAEAYERINTYPIDLILCDIRMPEENGIELIKKIKSLFDTIPVIFMSAYTDSATLLKIIPLKIDHFLVKPIKTQEVLNHFNEIVSKYGDRVLTDSVEHYELLNGVNVNLTFKNVTLADKEILLTKKEFELLAILIHHHHIFLDKNQLEYLLWGDEAVSQSSLKTLIKKLRAKIGEDSILSLRTMGYKVAMNGKK